MKKFLPTTGLFALLLFMGAGCATKIQKNTNEESVWTSEKYGVTVDFQGPFKVTEGDPTFVEFGPMVTPSEGPGDERMHAFTLRVTPRRGVEDIDADLKMLGDKASVTTKTEPLTVSYTDRGLCEITVYEVIGPRYNYVVSGNCQEETTEMRAVVESIDVH